MHRHTRALQQTNQLDNGAWSRSKQMQLDTTTACLVEAKDDITTLEEALLQERYNAAQLATELDDSRCNEQQLDLQLQEAHVEVAATKSRLKAAQDDWQLERDHLEAMVPCCLLVPMSSPAASTL